MSAPKDEGCYLVSIAFDYLLQLIANSGVMNAGHMQPAFYAKFVEVVNVVLSLAHGICKTDHANWHCTVPAEKCIDLAANVNCIMHGRHTVFLLIQAVTSRPPPPPKKKEKTLQMS